VIVWRLQNKEMAELRKKIEASAEKYDMLLVGGRAVVNLVKDHLFALDERGNKMGAPRTHFYSAAAKSVSQVERDGDAVSFSITKIGLAQRWLGGTIKAGQGTSSATGGPTKYLAIPARTEAVGVPPSEFPDLKFIPRRGGGAMLVQALQTQVSITGRKKKTITRGSVVGGLVMYWLVKSVTQLPDPSVMPTDEEMLGAAHDAIDSYLSRRLAS